MSLTCWLLKPMSPRRYQPPKSQHGCGGGAYMAGGGGIMGMSAANAAVGNSDAAPTAINNLTLRIGFVLLASEAGKDGLTSELTAGRCPQKLKRHLTLIF